jgi:hypothetical protein
VSVFYYSINEVVFELIVKIFTAKAFIFSSLLAVMFSPAYSTGNEIGENYVSMSSHNLSTLSNALILRL